MIKRLSEKYREALSVLYPRHCPVCDEIVDQTNEKICLSCMRQLKIMTPPWCVKCGKKINEGEELCKDCMEKTHIFIRGRALYEYGSAAETVYRFKYGGRREYADYFGEQMGDFLGEYILSRKPDALVPIPLHKKRMIVRGYNQAELLAKAIGRQLGIPVITDYLIRVKNTIPQKKLNPAERQNNLKKAFNITKNDVKLKSIILVDDIYTTGATMDEAASVLLHAGAEKVYYVTLTCGESV